MCIGPLKSFNVFKILSILKFQVYYFVIIRVLYYNFLCKSNTHKQFVLYKQKKKLFLIIKWIGGENLLNLYFVTKLSLKKVLFDQYEYRLPTCFIPNGSHVNK